MSRTTKPLLVVPLALGVAGAAFPVLAADLIVSVNDAKYQRVEGRDTIPRTRGRDTLTLCWTPPNFHR